MRRLMTKNLLAALEFAAGAHLGQKRKDPEGSPYISHPFAVGLVLERLGYEEDVVIAGILHDVIEDTNFTIRDIESKFGKKVAKFVLGVTEKNKLDSWEKRKIDYRENLKEQPGEALAISGADLLCNRLDLLMRLQTGVLEALNKFEVSLHTILDNDKKRIEIIKRGVSGELIHEIEKIERELEKYA